MSDAGGNSDGVFNGDVLAELIGIGVAIVGGWFLVLYLLPDDWRLKYAMRYLVSYENVKVAARPTDCDFLWAPIGRKNCHYEMRVTRVRWSRSARGETFVSFDDGAWVREEPISPLKIPSSFVYVSWEKVQGF